MDTNDLTEKAHVIIERAGDITPQLRLNLCALAIQFSDEDAYLFGIEDFLAQLQEDPQHYLEFWQLSELDSVVFQEKAKQLIEYIVQVRAIPIDQRY
ncbi:hypothetical protein [Spirulina subsalsa]|uniref:hypothetical protein n=1 Tax=Spirulina subsalsa TaxID=54311 RepID=UPI0003814CC6|nr:hypothetical protein [Spirulina subsalsa]